MATQGRSSRELNSPANRNAWKRTRKKGYEVFVSRPPIGHKDTNFLEGAQYVSNEKKSFFLSGTRGERWNIDGAKLAKTYEFTDGTPISGDSLKTKTKPVRINGQSCFDWVKLRTKQGAGQETNWAFYLPINIIKNYPVKTSWGDTLIANRDGIPHGKGDFLVCSVASDGGPNLNDVWVVNGEVFPRTYDMRAFPGLVDERTLSGGIVEPRSILAAYMAHTK